MNYVLFLLKTLLNQKIIVSLHAKACVIDPARQKEQKKGKIMASVLTSEDIVLTIPNSDLSFLRALTKKMGWTMKRRRKTGIEKGLEDIRKGHVYSAKDSEDLFKQILG